jgi:hypothetical protein
MSSPFAMLSMSCGLRTTRQSRAQKKPRGRSSEGRQKSRTIDDPSTKATGTPLTSTDVTPMRLPRGLSRRVPVVPGIGVSIVVGLSEIEAENRRQTLEQLTVGNPISDGRDMSGDDDAHISELGLIAAGILTSAGFDGEYEPTRDAEWRGEAASVAVWDQWKARANEHGQPMSTCGDIVDFMTGLGILDQEEINGMLYWRLAKNVKSARVGSSMWRARDARPPVPRRTSRPRR